MNKRMLTLILIPAALSSASIFACQDGASDQKTRELANFTALKAQGKDATLFSFQEQKCAPLDLSRNDGDASGYLPSDEDWQGLYSIYRLKGDKPLEALTHVYSTMHDSNNIGLDNATPDELSFSGRVHAMVQQYDIGE